MENLIREQLAEENPDMLFANGFDDCLLGICSRCGWENVAAYSTEKILKKLQKDMTEIEALEYFEFNIAGAFVGKFTPVFVRKI